MMCFEWITSDHNIKEGFIALLKACMLALVIRQVDSLQGTKTRQTFLQVEPICYWAETWAFTPSYSKYFPPEHHTVDQDGWQDLLFEEINTAWRSLNPLILWISWQNRAPTLHWDKGRLANKDSCFSTHHTDEHSISFFWSTTWDNITCRSH